MPEYLAPGVYVEETSFRAKSIEGVGTSTTAFVGPTLKGPLLGPAQDQLGGVPDVITSYGEFERLYGGFDVLDFDGQAGSLNYVAHAVRAYFDNGGSRLYFARVYTPGADAGVAASRAVDVGGGNTFRFTARFPGTGYQGSVTVHPKLTSAGAKMRKNAPVGSLLRTGGAAGAAFFVKNAGGEWQGAAALPADEAQIQTPELVTLSVEAKDLAGNVVAYDELGVHRDHPRFIGTVMAKKPSRRADAVSAPYFFDGAAVGADARALLDALVDLAAAKVEDQARTFEVAGGSDGAVPTAQAHADALVVLQAIEDIAIVAAPGSSEYGSGDARLALAQAVRDALITHAELCKYRVAVLDVPSGQTTGSARTARGVHDSKYAALYYPWVIVANPLARPADETVPKEIALPPSGFLCGIYARNDVERGVWKAPANETVRGALRLEQEITFGEQQVLNPEGINCLRFFPGRGIRVWGARTISSDPEWKYVNVRRYFVYLEHSIDRSTQWAVFEPNGEALWANVRTTVSDFLYNEWKSGALLGSKPEEAFFVRCDRSTMTQNDLDNGRLICLIGVAALKPAEFVIFRIGQKTADARS